VVRSGLVAQRGSKTFVSEKPSYLVEPCTAAQPACRSEVAQGVRVVDAPPPLHNDAFQTHVRASPHQPGTLLGREGLGEFHGIRLQGGL